MKKISICSTGYIVRICTFVAANAGCDEVVQDIQQKLKIMVFLRLTLP